MSLGTHNSEAHTREGADRVRIVELPAALLAVTHAFGASPEPVAWAKLSRFAQALPDLPEGTRWFGFNAPDPLHPGDAYGYELWMTVPPGTQPSHDVELRRFEGGRFAALRCTLATLPQTWVRLLEWAARSGARLRAGMMLEECLTPPLDGQIRGDLRFDLLLPLDEG